MSRHVKIGGIGINPIIDKINAVDKAHIKALAANKMEQLIDIDKRKDADQYADTELGKIICKKVPLVFDWEEDDGMENNRTV